MSCDDISRAAPTGRLHAAPASCLTRQMPGDAGVVFITLSDETNIANVVVWPRLVETFRREIMGARLLLIEGKVQRSPENVVHLVAERIVDRTDALDRLSEDNGESPLSVRRPAGMSIAIRAMCASCPSRATFTETPGAPPERKFRRAPPQYAGVMPNI